MSHSTKQADSYRPAQEIASTFGFTRDYVARLARTGAIPARKIGVKWFVDPAGFKAFVARQEDLKLKQRLTLAEARRREYTRRSSSHVNEGQSTHADRVEWREPTEDTAQTTGGADRVAEPITEMLRSAALQRAYGIPTMHAALPVYPLTPAIDFLHRISALFTAFILVFGSYAAIDAHFREHALTTIREDARSVVVASFATKSAIERGIAVLDSAIMQGDYATRIASSFLAILGEEERDALLR